jgi:hypothetical protein
MPSTFRGPVSSLLALEAVMKSTTSGIGLLLSILFCLTLSSTTPPSAAGLAVAGNMPDVRLAPSSLNFACNFNPDRGCECTEGQPATLTNLGDTDVIITSISPPSRAGACVKTSYLGVWGQTNDCPRTLEAGKSCTIRVNFRPATGRSAGELLVYLDGYFSPLKVSLLGAAQCSACGR